MTDHELWLGDLGAMAETIEQAMALSVEHDGAVVRIMAHSVSQRDACDAEVGDDSDSEKDGVHHGSVHGDRYQITVGFRS